MVHGSHYVGWREVDPLLHLPAVFAGVGVFENTSIEAEEG